MSCVKKVLRGLLIGVAGIVPGVSGGTLAVSMGVYGQIIGAVSHLFQRTGGERAHSAPLRSGDGCGHRRSGLCDRDPVRNLSLCGQHGLFGADPGRDPLAFEEGGIFQERSEEVRAGGGGVLSDDGDRHRGGGERAAAGSWPSPRRRRGWPP